MSTELIIGAIGLPIVGAAHCFASNLGYRHTSYRFATLSALRVGFLLSVVTAAWVIVRL